MENRYKRSTIASVFIISTVADGGVKMLVEALLLWWRVTAVPLHT